MIRAIFSWVYAGMVAMITSAPVITAFGSSETFFKTASPGGRCLPNEWYGFFKKPFVPLGASLTMETGHPESAISAAAVKLPLPPR